MSDRHSIIYAPSPGSEFASAPLGATWMTPRRAEQGCGRRGSDGPGDAQHREISEAIAAEFADQGAVGDLAELPGDAVEGHLRDLLACADRASASATVVAGVPDSSASLRALIEGWYASVRRFLEVEAGLAPASAAS